MHLVREPHGLNEPHAFAVKRNCARQVINRRLALEHDGPQTAQPEQVREDRGQRANKG
jgi:hypothetical protein